MSNAAPAIISGDFSTFRHVQGRKVLQLVIEIPAEQAAAVFSTFGYPGSGNPIPVAVARLVAPPAEQPSVKERTPFTRLPLAQQASLRCRERDFWRYLTARRPGPAVLSEDDAADAVREICDIDSRSELARGGEPARRWTEMEADYFAWQRSART